jgi:dolichol-phosphate mannosyltransferase
MKKLSIIIPCYYNQDNVRPTFEVLHRELKSISNLNFEIVFVDDGSKDQTFNRLTELKNEYPDILKIVKLVKNVGSYTAIVAGLKFASSGDCFTVISADLQDPPELIKTMHAEWVKGTKLILGQRIKKNDGFFNDLFSDTFNFLLRKCANDYIPKGGFDFVFFDKALRDQLININERNTNSLYLLTWMGYQYTCVPYERQQRTIGKSRWTAAKKIKLLIDSFVSFTYAPIRIISFTGILLGLFSLMYLIYILYAKISGLIVVEGWTTTMIILLLVSSFQMMALGVIGEYVWRCLDAVRGRPQYIIDQTIE